MNFILERTDQVPFFTDMRRVFGALGLNCEDFDWYISDIETNYYPDGFQNIDQWMSGRELKALITENEIQFIWAVFSAFEPGTRFEVIEPPCVDGNPDYWNGSGPGPQLKGARFEIACWDSSATLLIGLPEELMSRFCAAYSDTKKLADARE